MVAEALKPAKIRSVTPDQATRTLLVKADADQLSLAIGKRGHNARLAARLTGWEINIKADTSAEDLFKNKKDSMASYFASVLPITSEMAATLVVSGMNSMEILACGCEPQDIGGILGLDLSASTAIHDAARREHEKVAAKAK